MRYHFFKTHWIFWQYFDNHRIIDVIWQSINCHVRVVWRPKLLLQCWSFSTTAPTTRIASKPWKPRQTMDQTSATSVKVPKRLSDFPLKLFSSQSNWVFKSFISDALSGKSSNLFLTCFEHDFSSHHFWSHEFSQAETDDLHRQGLGISGVGHKFIVPMASLKWQVAIPVSCHEAPLLATMWKNWTQQILDHLPWMTKRERKLTFCNLHQLTQVESKSQVTSKKINAFDKTCRFYITQLASPNMINSDIKCAGATVGTGVGATCVTCVTGARMGFRISL